MTNFFITGDGFLATHLIYWILNNYVSSEVDITIFSRSEKAQLKLKHNFPDTRVHTVIGDIRDFNALLSATRGKDVIIHTAALKRIDVCENWPREAIKTNVMGSLNVLEAAEQNRVKKIILVSTDKSVNATTCYGSSKFLMEQLIHSQSNGITKKIAVRYGNIFGSTGSVVPIWQEAVRKGEPLHITNPSMTRFFMSVWSACRLILTAVDKGEDGDLFIYKAKSTDLKTLASIFSPNQEVTGTPWVEKTDEALITVAEGYHAELFEKDIYRISDAITNVSSLFTENQTSDNAERLTPLELEEFFGGYVVSCKGGFGE